MSYCGSTDDARGARVGVHTFVYLHGLAVVDEVVDDDARATVGERERVRLRAQSAERTMTAETVDLSTIIAAPCRCTDHFFLNYWRTGLGSDNFCPVH